MNIVINETDKLKDALANEVNKRLEGDKNITDALNAEKKEHYSLRKNYVENLLKSGNRDKIEGKCTLKVGNI